MTTETKTAGVLTDELLLRCQDRAPGYDKNNTFFQEDFDELKEAGYLLMAVPKEFGGLGMTHAEVQQETRRLAYHAAPTALALNMHIYWTGVAADLLRSGDESMRFVLEEAGKGKVFAAGHGESGNDIPLLLSSARAERADGGYKIYGRKNFGSLSPVWDWLGIHAMDTSDPDNPKVVHGFFPRDSEGYTISDNWDVLGMRATQSHDTVLDGVFVADENIMRVIAPGMAGFDAFLLSVFIWALMGFGNVYYGIAQRAVDISVESLKKRQSVGLTRGYAYHAGYQNTLAEMVIELESIGPHLDRVAQDWTDGVDYGLGWGTKIVSVKYHAVEGSWRIVDSALEILGGFGIFEPAGFTRIWRDARLGKIHPASGFLAKEFAAKIALGIDLDEQPRWG